MNDRRWTLDGRPYKLDPYMTDVEVLEVLGGERIWICVGTGQWFRYVDEEWIEVFGAVPTDTCPECGRHYTNQGCDWYYKVSERGLVKEQ